MAASQHVIAEFVSLLMSSNVPPERSVRSATPLDVVWARAGAGANGAMARIRDDLLTTTARLQGRGAQMGAHYAVVAASR